MLAYDKSGNRIKDERNGLGVTHRIQHREDVDRNHVFQEFQDLLPPISQGKAFHCGSARLNAHIEALGHGLLMQDIGQRELRGGAV